MTVQLNVGGVAAVAPQRPEVVFSVTLVLSHISIGLTECSSHLILKWSFQRQALIVKAEKRSLSSHRYHIHV